jgi:hypothetical protein
MPPKPAPYVVQLDAGYYAFKDASVVIPAYVSLRGALVNSTTGIRSCSLWIFRKTNTTRRTELLRLLLAIPAQG